LGATERGGGGKGPRGLAVVGKKKKWPLSWRSSGKKGRIRRRKKKDQVTERGARPQGKSGSPRSILCTKDAQQGRKNATCPGSPQQSFGGEKSFDVSLEGGPAEKDVILPIFLPGEKKEKKGAPNTSPEGEIIKKKGREGSTGGTRFPGERRGENQPAWSLIGKKTKQEGKKKGKRHRAAPERPRREKKGRKKTVFVHPRSGHKREGTRKEEEEKGKGPPRSVPDRGASKEEGEEKEKAEIVPSGQPEGRRSTGARKGEKGKKNGRPGLTLAHQWERRKGREKGGWRTLGLLLRPAKEGEISSQKRNKEISDVPPAAGRKKLCP